MFIEQLIVIGIANKMQKQRAHISEKKVKMNINKTCVVKAGVFDK